MNVECRTADDLEHVGGRGLLLKRLFEVESLRLHLVEQPCVLDRDNGLIGEGFQEIDRFVVERAGVAARDADRAYRNAIAQHRHHHHAAPADGLCEFLDVLRYMGSGVNVSCGYDNTGHCEMQSALRIWARSGLVT
jgi:hypothetical protein